MDLPRTIPLFPLPTVVLFPGPLLPLHIFEPRYRAMVRDAEAGDRLIGMVLARGANDDAAPDAPTDIFPIGCAGELVKVEPLDDGRSYILLRGLREFRIEREIPGKPYRQAEVVWVEDDATLLEPGVRAQLRESIARLLEAAPQANLERLLAEEGVADELFVNFWSFVLDVPAIEKQALLAETRLADRAQRLREVLTFRLATLRAPGGPRDDPERPH